MRLGRDSPRAEILELSHSRTVSLSVTLAPELYLNACLHSCMVSPYTEMPRDLFSAAPREDTLVASPESATPRPELSDGTEGTVAAGQDFTIYRDEAKPANAHPLHHGRAKGIEKDNLHPYVQTLSISNLEDCVALEKAVFPENERCSREKVGVPNRVLYNSRACARTSTLA